MAQISFTFNGKEFQAASNDTFKDLIDNAGLKGKAQDKSWTVNGNPIQPQNNTKVGQLIQNGSKVQCNDGGNQTNQQNAIKPQGFNQPQAPFGQPQTPFNQLTAPFSQSTAPVGQSTSTFAQPQKQNPQPQPSFNFNQNQQNPFAGFNKFTPAPVIQQQTNSTKRQPADTQGTQEQSKQIKEFRITIKNEAKTVEFENLPGNFKAVFLEEDANENAQKDIYINPNDIINDQSEQVKATLAKDSSKSTKVLFLRGYAGICIRWYTGMITKFEFALVE